jgi:hypothetical protein
LEDSKAFISPTTCFIQFSLGWPLFSSSTSWAHSLLTDNKIWEEVKIKRP